MCSSSSSSSDSMLPAWVLEKCNSLGGASCYQNGSGHFSAVRCSGTFRQYKSPSSVWGKFYFRRRVVAVNWDGEIFGRACSQDMHTRHQERSPTESVVVVLPTPRRAASLFCWGDVFCGVQQGSCNTGNRLSRSPIASKAHAYDPKAGASARTCGNCSCQQTYVCLGY